MNVPNNINFNEVFRSLPDLYLILSPEYIIADASDSYLEATLTKRQQIQGKYLFDVFPDNPDASEANATKNLRYSLEQVLKTKQPHVMALQHYDVPKPEGGFEEKYWSPVNLPLLNDKQEITGIIHKVTDVTERVIMETERKITIQHAKRKAEEHSVLLRVLETIPQIAWTALPDGTSKYFNKKWYVYTEKDFTQSLKERWTGAAHPEDLNICMEKWKNCLKTGETFQCEHRILRGSDSTYRWHLTLAKPIRNEKNEITLWVGTCTDIHEQKMSNEQKDEFISLASHELKTPLTSIKAYSELLERQIVKTKAEPECTYIAKVTNSINTLNSLVADLLDISKVQSGNLTFDLSVFDFSQLVTAMVESFRNTTPTHTFIIETNKQVKVFGDKIRLEQVVSNLISNAVKYSPGKNKVIINSYSENNKLVFSVQDFGMGIKKNLLVHLFEKFYRAERKAHKIQGLGLGLFICSEIIKKHKGEIKVESEEGKGSVFTFTLPL